MAFAAQFVVRFLFDHHEQIARDTTCWSFIAHAAHIELHAFFDTGGDLDRQHHLFAHQPVLIAAGCALAGDLANTAAGGAGAHCLHGTQKGALHARHLAAAFARGTRPVLAALATHQLGHLDLLLGAQGDLLQRKLDSHTQVAALHHTVPPRAATETAKGTTSEGFSENVAELGEDVLHVHTAALEPTAPEATRCIVTESVVLGLLVRIAQDLVRGSRFLELFLGRLVARVFVRMELDGLLAVGLLDLVGTGVLLNAQDLVRVAFAHRECRRSTVRERRSDRGIIRRPPLLRNGSRDRVGCSLVPPRRSPCLSDHRWGRGPL